MQHAIKGQPLPIFGDGEQTRAFSHVHDVARAFILSATLSAANGNAVNIGSDKPVSVSHLAKLVSEVMEVPHEVAHLEKRHEVIHAVANHSRQQEVFGLGDTVELKAGLLEMASWVKNTALKRESEAPDIDFEIEVWDKIPPSWLSYLKPESSRHLSSESAEL